MNGEGSGGFAFVNTSSLTNLGEAVLGINTTGRNDIQVSWSGGTIAAVTSGHIYYVRAQYRIGTTGAYTDLPNTSFDQITDTSTVVSQKSFGPITLPTTCNNQPDVEVRWVYYHISGSSTRPEKNVTNINVTSNAIGATPVVAISNTSPAHANVSPGTGNLILQTYNMNITGATDTISGLTIVTGGNYEASDISDFKLWYSSSAVFTDGTAILLAQISSPSAAGSQTFPAFSQIMNVTGGTKYFYVTADLSVSAVSGDSINIAGTPFSNINLGATATATGTDPVNAANYQVINASSVALSSASPATGNIGSGTVNNVIQAYSLTVTTAPATISGLAITTAGTYTSSDVVDLKCWYSSSATFNAATAALLSVKTSSLSSGSQVFPAFTSTVIPVGTGYIYITSDLSSGAALGDNISVAANAFSNFNLGGAAITGVNPVPASNTQTISSATVAVSNTSPAAENIGEGRINVLLQTYNLSVTSVAAAINGLTVVTGGTYSAADINNLECWYSASSTFSAGTATLLSTLAAPGAAGGQVFPSFTAQTIAPGTTGYLFITANISAAATAGHTINIGAVPFSDLNFGSATLTGANPVAAANVLTISTYTDPVPYNLSAGTYLFNNWPSSSPAGTYPANMIFHYMSAADPSLAATAAGDYVVAYDYSGSTRISGQGSNGYSMFNNGSGNAGGPATTLGEAVLAINTTGRSAIQVSWTAGTIASNTGVTAIRPQYRIGTTGSYTDLPYTTIGQIEDTSGATGISKNFGPITLPSSCEGVADVEIRWAYYTQSGSAEPEMNVTNVQVTSSVAATSSIAVTATSPAAANIGQGSYNNLLQAYDLSVSSGTATLSGLAVSTAGTYSASDITDLKCWYSSSSTFSPGTSTLLSTNSSVTAAGAQVFSSFIPQAVPVGSGYIFITADVASGATIGDVIKVDTTSFADFNFGSGTLTGTDPVAAANAQTIVAPPNIAITSISTAAANVYALNNVVLQTYGLTVSSVPATLTGLTVTTNGTYAANDITDLKCWYSTSSSFSAGTATLLAAITTTAAAGTQIFPTFLQTLPVGTGYIFITTDIVALPSSGNTIYIDTTHLADFTAGTATFTGTDPVPASGVQTISVHDPSPYTLSGGMYTFNNWPSTSAAGTYPANMIFHYMNAADPLLTSVPSADYTGTYSSTATAGIEGQGASGFVFYNKGGVNIGEAVLALNTTGEVNVNVSWTGGTFVASTGSRTYAIKAQYRIGTTGAYTDLSTDTTRDEYVSNGAAVGSYTFEPVTLPSSCENQSDVEVRWLFYYIGSTTGNRPQLNVTNITVTGNAPTDTISGSVTICAGSSAVISSTGGTPGALVTLSPGGASFTLSGAGTGSVSVTPSVTTTYTSSVSKSGITASGSGNATITVANQQWAGTTSTDWNTAANWTCGRIPVVTDNVIIPNGTINSPDLSSGNAYTANLTVSGAVLTLGSGSQLEIAGNLTNNGTIGGNGTLLINGTTAQLLSGNGSVNNITIANTAGVAIDTASDTIGVAGTILLNAGTLHTNGRLMLLSDSSGSGSIGAITGGAIIGDVTVQQYVFGKRAYRFWAHPFSTKVPLSQIQNYIDVTGVGGSANGFTTTETNAPSAYWYNTLYGNSSDGSDPGWRAFTSTYGTPDSNMLHQYQGMRLFVRGTKGEGLLGYAYTDDAATIRMWGTVNTGAQSVTMTKGAGDGQDYNLLGNPYPSVTDIGTVIANASASGLVTGGAFYVWDPYLSTSGQFVTQTIGSAYYMGANESFEVRTAANGNALSFTESNKGTAVSAALMRTTGNEYVTLYIYDTAYHPWDILNLKFSDAATDNDDARYDGDKPPSPAPLNFYSWSSDHKKLALDVRPFSSGGVVPLGIVSSYAQDFIIRAENVNVPKGNQVYLHDKYLQTYTLLQQGAAYKFSITKDAASQGDQRFELSMSPSGVAAAQNTGLSVQLLPNPATDDITITYTATGNEATSVRILDATGACVITRDLGNTNSGTAKISVSSLASGLYIVEFTSGDHKVVNRLIKE